HKADEANKEILISAHFFRSVHVERVSILMLTKSAYETIVSTGLMQLGTNDDQQGNGSFLWYGRFLEGF
ncbi:hypothetical protein RZS08_09770, partial [Arthrospira platensis SPKY1]|nr:hypothetical protein [Arthrospira platensis SPKY1]